jgi:hypothetical protein
VIKTVSLNGPQSTISLGNHKRSISSQIIINKELIKELLPYQASLKDSKLKDNAEVKLLSTKDKLKRT